MLVSCADVGHPTTLAPGQLSGGTAMVAAALAGPAAGQAPSGAGLAFMVPNTGQAAMVAVAPHAAASLAQGSGNDTL